MPLIDPSETLRPLQIQNPADLALKSLQIRNLGSMAQVAQVEAAQKQRELAQQQTMDQAARTNMTPTGLDRQGYVTSLRQSDFPLLGDQENVRFMQMDLNALSAKHQLAKQILIGIGSQEDLDYGDKVAQQYGLPSLKKKLGETYSNDPGSQFQFNLRDNLKKNLDIEGQIAESHKQIEEQTNRIKALADAAGAGAINKMQFQKMAGFPAQAGGAVPQGAENMTKFEFERAKDIAGMQEKMGDDLDPNKARTGNYGTVAAKIQAGQRIKFMLDRYKSGDDLIPSEVREAAMAYAQVLSPGSPALQTVNELINETKRMKYGAELQSLLNKPIGAGQGRFVDRLSGNIDAEMKGGMGQMNQMVQSKLGKWTGFKQMAPDAHDAVVKNTYDKILNGTDLLKKPAGDEAAHAVGTKKTFGGKTYEYMGGGWKDKNNWKEVK